MWGADGCFKEGPTVGQVKGGGSVGIVEAASGKRGGEDRGEEKVSFDIKESL